MYDHYRYRPIWTVDSLLKKHPSRPYNPLIANALFRAGHIESWGRGIEKMAGECREHGIEPPEYSYEFSGLMLTFKAALPADNQHEAHDEGPVEGPVGAQSSAVLCTLFDEPLSAGKIMEALSLGSKTGAFKRTIKELLMKGLVEYTIPEKPNSRLQKYRLTEKGRALAWPPND